MTHNEIYLKLFRYNYRKYVLLVTCNAFLISVCYFFASLLTNNEFMDAGIVDPIISSNVYLPTFMTFAFAVFFVLYSHISFNIGKERTYGVFETIGIDIKEIRKMIIFENSLVAVIAIAIGLVIGTVLSLLFLLVIKQIIGIDGVSVSLFSLSYKVTILFFVAMYIVAITYSAFSIPRKTIRRLLDEERTINKGYLSSRGLFFLGLAMFCAVVIFLIVFFDQNKSNSMMLSYLITAIALLLLIFNSMWIIDYIEKKKKTFYYRKVVFFTNIKYRFSSDKKIFLFSVILIGMVMFFQTFSIATIKLGSLDVELYNPFQIVYYEYEGSEVPSNSQIRQIAKENDITLTTNKKAVYYYDDSQQCAIFSANDLKGLIRIDGNINKGECILFSQYGLHDGYPHYDTIDDSAIVLSKDEFKESYKIKKIRHDVLINDIAIDTEYCAIINSEDYDALTSNKAKLQFGNIRLINCKDLDQSTKLCQVLCKQYHDLVEDGISTKAIEKEKSDQSARFLLLLISIMDILLFALDMVLIYFKMESSLKAFQDKYLSMWKIGFTKEQIRKSILQYTNYLLIYPTVLSVIIGGFFVVTLMQLSLLGGYTALWGCGIGACMMLIQFAISEYYSRRYLDKVIVTNNALYSFPPTIINSIVPL